VREAREVIRPLGTRTILVGILECCTALAAAAGQPERALRLSAAAAALRETTGLGTPGDGSPARGVSERVTALLPSAAAAAAVADGRAMALEAALEYAFGAEPAAATLPAPPTSPAPALDGSVTVLTRREREVAALVASGLTNRAIAARLVITERTAANHVEHILAKLGLRNRAQITAWVIQHGLGQAPGDPQSPGQTPQGHRVSRRSPACGE
jgi:non-specific serine/threonine protein kinase